MNASRKPLASAFMLLTAVVVAVAQQPPRMDEPLGCPAGPVSGPTQTIAPEDFVELERTECLGTCPTFVVRVQGNGDVTWSGKTFVKIVGSASASIESERARSLIENVRSAGFWSLCEQYRSGRTDAPTAFTTAKIGNQQKRISNYGNTGPAVLRRLESDIEEAANTYLWLHGEPQSQIFAFVMRNDPAAPPLQYAQVPRISTPMFVYPTTRFSDILDSPKPGMTPLMRASGRGDIAEVRRLLAERVDTNAQDSSGWTALMYATSARQPIDIVYALLAAGADPNKKSAMGQTAVMAASAAFQDRAAMLRQIVGAGGEVQAQDKNGQTALMFATTGIVGMATLSETDARYSDYSDAVSYLMTAGARVDVADVNGFTVLDQLDHLAKTATGRITTYDAIRGILTRK